jgi:hypothetical protein
LHFQIGALGSLPAQTFLRNTPNGFFLQICQISQKSTTATTHDSCQNEKKTHKKKQEKLFAKNTIFLGKNDKNQF